MKNLDKILAATLSFGLVAGCSSELSEEDQATLDARLAEENKLPETLSEIAASEEDLSTLNAAMGLTALPALPQAEEGPFTYFMPTNAAFSKLGSEASNELMTPESKDKLTSILGYHVVKGEMSADDIAKAISDGGGTATMTSMQGAKFTVSMDGDKIVLEDTNGNKSTVISDAIKSDNGAAYKVDTVLMPS